MNSKSLLLLLAALAISVIAYYFNANTKQHAVDADSSLIPSLAANLNSVIKFTITEADDTILSEVSKSDKGWVVEGRDGYAANKSAVRILFNNLVEAKLVEAKTSDPNKYSKLGVEDVINKNAQGILFSVDGLNKPVHIIFGNAGSSGKNTQYVRRKGEVQSWLINKKFKLNTDVTEWLQKDIFDIPPERIKTVQITQSDGSVVNIANDGEEEYEYTLDATVPEGLVLFESEIYQVANALSSLQLRDVATFSKLNTESVVPIVSVFKTFDGLTITTKAYAIDINTYFTIDVAFSADDVDQNVVNKAEQTESTSDAAIKSDPKAAKELATKANQKMEGWAYLFPAITKDALIKKTEDFFIEPGA
jgi:hypothetical protein